MALYWLFSMRRVVFFNQILLYILFWKLILNILSHGSPNDKDYPSYNSFSEALDVQWSYCSLKIYCASTELQLLNCVSFLLQKTHRKPSWLKHFTVTEVLHFVLCLAWAVFTYAVTMVMFTRGNASSISNWFRSLSCNKYSVSSRHSKSVPENGIGT